MKLKNLVSKNRRAFQKMQKVGMRLKNLVSENRRAFKIMQKVSVMLKNMLKKNGRAFRLSKKKWVYGGRKKRKVKQKISGYLAQPSASQKILTENRRAFKKMQKLV